MADAAVNSLETSEFTGHDLEVGYPFTYTNGAVTITGSIGAIVSHDKESVHVISDSYGQEVCAIRNGVLKVVHEGTFIVPTSDRCAFSFMPVLSPS